MVIDLQDAGETLEKAVARSQIRLLGSSSKTLAAVPRLFLVGVCEERNLLVVWEDQPE